MNVICHEDLENFNYSRNEIIPQTVEMVEGKAVETLIFLIGLSRKRDRWWGRMWVRDEGRGGNVGRKGTTRRKKETVVASTARREERSGEKERERYMEPRGVALQPARFAYLRSLFCMPSLPPSWLSLLLLRFVPSERPPSSLWLPRLLVRLFARSLTRSRCTVAFGLCIIITVTASSSWLVVEESHLVSLPLPGRRCLLVVSRTDCSWETDTSAKLYDLFDSRVRVN